MYRVRVISRVWLCVCVSLLGCAPAVLLTEPARNVIVSREPPSAGAVHPGVVVGSHGAGCGFGGLRGSRDGAMADLRNEAATLGANYVKILEEVEPHKEPGCLDNEYRIEGTAYREAVSSGPVQKE